MTKGVIITLFYMIGSVNKLQQQYTSMHKKTNNPNFVFEFSSTKVAVLGKSSGFKELLKFLHPNQIFFTVLIDHVLVKEIKCAGLDSSYSQIPLESLLQVLIQITGRENRKTLIDHKNI